MNTTLLIFDCRVLLFTCFPFCVRKILRTASLVLLCILSLEGYSQNGSDQTAQLPSIVPHSPTVASLGKYIDFPVSLYTGQANISIPLYELQVGDITVPVSLSYHTGGIKVEEISSFVGLGWTLMPNYTIIRTINGQPDESVPYLFDKPPYPLTKPKFDAHYRSTTGAYDSQHDFFHFSIGGYSGKFVLDLTNQVEGEEALFFPDQDLGVTIESVNRINSAMTLTTPEGITYTFGKTEYNNTSTSCTNGSISSSNFIVPTTWFLTRIDSKATGEYVEFQYETRRLDYFTNGVQTEYEPLTNGSGTLDDFSCMVDNEIYTQRLLSITSSEGHRVDFIEGEARIDLPGDYILDRVVISDQRGQRTKRYDFSYQYLDGNILKPVGPSNVSVDPDRAHLLLTSIQETNNNGTAKAPYQFEYNSTSTGLPSRFSYAQDAWGYYNGQNNKTLVPARRYGGRIYPGADRQPRLSYAQQGSLKKVTFPTGGYTTYEYGLNQVQNYSFFRYEGDATPNYESYRIGRGNLDKREEIFTLDVAQDAEINFFTSTSSSFCSNSPCEIDLELFSLDGDEEDELLFQSFEYRTVENVEEFVSVTEELRLGAGRYKLKMTINDEEWAQEQDEFTLQVRWIIPSSEEETEGEEYNAGGGLRVERVRTYDPLTTRSLEKNFRYGNGYLNYYSSFSRSARITRGESAGSLLYTNVLVRSSYPQEPLSLTNGGHVGYDKVTVKEVGNGYTEHFFYTPNDHPDYLVSPVRYGGGDIALPNSGPGEFNVEFGSVERFNETDWLYPYSLKDDKDWKRGLVKRQDTYNESRQPVRSISHMYNFYDDPAHPVYDPNRVRTVIGSKTNTERASVVNGSVTGEVDIIFYQLESSYYDLAETQEITYDQNGDAFTTITTYDYEPTYHQLRASRLTNSQNQVIQKTYQYATDYSNSNSIYGSDHLREAHMHSQILEQTTRVGGISTQKSTTTYDDIAGQVVPKIITNYPTGDKTSSSEAQQTEYEYDTYGNITQVLGTDGVPTSYVWGYNYTLPVAQIVGALYETEVKTKLNLTALQSMDGKELQTALNNLRSLDDVQVTTYTHDPLVGITSSTDPSGRISTYHYDDLNRLQWIESEEGHVVQKFDYQYAQ